MKKFKSILAMLLVLVMVISCVGTAFAANEDSGKIAGKAPVSELGGKNAKTEKNAKGFRSPEFVSQNAYKYAEDETVRAIVVLEGDAEADVAERNSQRAVSHRAKLMGEHEKIRGAMSGIDYTLLCDYTALLNGFACEVAYGDLDKIAAIEGVKAVHISNRYAVPTVEEAKDVKMAFANIMTGNAASVYDGYNGSGMVVAVLDTGLRVTHEAFQVYEGVKLTETLKAEDVSKAGAEGKYVSAKVPFAYDYADQDNDVADQDGHGTHVSGTVGGLVIESDGAVTFQGGAPMAQILAMKVFYDEGGGTYSDIYFNALEDAYKLGADVINMSLGSASGFTFDAELETEVFGNIYKKLEEAGIVACMSAGNSGSMADYSTVGYIGPEYQDYGVVGSPATYEGNTSVASIENLAYPSYTIDVGEEHIPYVDSSTDASWKATFGGKAPIAYTVVYSVAKPEMISLGSKEDFAAADVKDKIAVVQRGELNFEEKVENAANAGAIGCIVVNNQAGTISMAIETFEVPAVSVPMTAANILRAGTELTVSNEMYNIENPLACQMSDFSSWGTSPDLTIDPAITSVGGNVYSSVNTADDAYDLYSGTSMACPNAAATFANVLQALKEKGVADKAERAEKAKAILESSAMVFTDLEGYLYSVRKQGAGLISSSEATYLMENGAYITNPLQQLGDDAEKTGKYSFEVELKNETDKPVEYFPYGVTMFDYIKDKIEDPEKTLLANTLTSDYLFADFTFDGKEDATCYYKQYKDCKDEWYHEYVDFVTYTGLMNGTGNGMFEPSSSMTRAMAVTVLYRAAGAPEVEAPSTFVDVPAGQWYSDAIAWAQNNAVVNGTSETTFSPDAKITREQLATILWRYSGGLEAELSVLEGFSDSANISDYAKTAMAWAVENGILNGDSGKLLPVDNATRAQFAAIITRYIGGSYECKGSAIVVPANSTKKCKVTITLNDDQKQYLDETFPNGAYLEGYVEFSNMETATHATYLAFYGDWTKAPILEKQDFRDFIQTDYLVNTEIANAETGETFADLGYTALDYMDVYTMPNMGYGYDVEAGEPLFYLGDNVLDFAPFSEKHISFTTPNSDADYIYTNSFALTPSQLRNAKHLIMTVTDAKTGEVYYVDDTEYLPKATFDEESGGWLASGIFVWDGKNAKGEYVPTGTVAHVNFDAVLPYGDTEVKNVWGFDVTVDYAAPVIESAVYDEAAKTLTVTASDEHYLQGIYLADDYSILDQAVFSSEKAGEGFTATFDVSGLQAEGIYEVYVAAIDYATNEVDEVVPLYEVGKDATVTFVTPSGENTIPCKTGDRFAFPACEDVPEGHEFMLWTRTDEKTISEDDVWNIDGMYFEGDPLTVTKSETFYALYAAGEDVPLEKTNYYATQEIDYSGDWAIGGLDFVKGNFDTMHPYVIGKDCEKVDVSAITDAEIGDWYVEFYTNAEGFRYTFEKIGDDQYTMKNLATGKYLALAGDKLAMVDTVTEEATWAIFANPESSAASIVYNYANPDMVLVYDDEAKEFAIYDDSVPYYTSEEGDEYYPSTWFCLWLYKCADTEFVVDHYTTQP